MDYIEKLKNELIKLDKDKLHNIIFELLVEEKLSYTDLTLIYTASLRNKEKVQQRNINGLALMLSYFIPLNNRKVKDKKFIESKSAYHLLKSRVFHTAGIEKSFIKIVKKNNYSEDEDGIQNN